MPDVCGVVASYRTSIGERCIRNWPLCHCWELEVVARAKELKPVAGRGVRPRAHSQASSAPDGIARLHKHSVPPAGTRRRIAAHSISLPGPSVSRHLSPAEREGNAGAGWGLSSKPEVPSSSDSGDSEAGGVDGAASQRHSCGGIDGAGRTFPSSIAMTSNWSFPEVALCPGPV